MYQQVESGGGGSIRGGSFAISVWDAVTEKSSKPIKDAVVKVTSAKGQNVKIVKEASVWKPEAKTVLPGKYSVMVEYPNYFPNTITFEVKTGLTVPVPVMLVPESITQPTGTPSITLSLSHSTATQGDVITMTATIVPTASYDYVWEIPEAGVLLEEEDQQNVAVLHMDTGRMDSGLYTITVHAYPAGALALQENGELTQSEVDSMAITANAPLMVQPRERIDVSPISMKRSAVDESAIDSLWPVIKNRTSAIAFEEYAAYMDRVMIYGNTDGLGRISESKKQQLKGATSLGFYGLEAYNLLKLATECFLMQEVGVALDQGNNEDIIDPELFDSRTEASRLGRSSVSSGRIISDLRDRYLQALTDEVSPQARVLPYFEQIRNGLRDIPLKPNPAQPNCYGILRSKLSGPPLIELIWSYWHEEGMLVQSMNAVSLRFQNRRLSDHDPLANVELDPLRPMSNLLWGYVQDEFNRLTVVRRAYEYDHQYGLKVFGKAVPELKSADSRSKFLEAFHNLLYAASIFFKEDDDTMVIADGFRVLNALKDVHFILAYGAHNQFGDLPWTARSEMLMQQWLLARPEMREFLRSRIMVPYRESWMDPVDTMKKLQGWNDVSVTHFHDLARFGEQIILSIRYGCWIDIDMPAAAATWARYWRPEIQGYLHSYRAVTGIDLSAEISDTRRVADRYLPPSVHIRNRTAPRAAQRPVQAPAPVPVNGNGNGNGRG